MEGFVELIFWLGVIGFVYFLPTIIAVSNDRRQKGAIATLNIVAGWTVIGWVVALVWAAVKDKEATP